jgi:hypothetical protein
MKKKAYKKLTVNLSPETAQKLRTYVSKTYPTETFGKLSEVVETAITEYLKKAENLQ